LSFSLYIVFMISRVKKFFPALPAKDERNQSNLIFDAGSENHYALIFVNDAFNFVDQFKCSNTYTYNLYVLPNDLGHVA
jgi:hypothetical protein